MTSLIPTNNNTNNINNKELKIKIEVGLELGAR
uniref:Uncharacterized protein n=1 Tax=Arundo donax TaxID=35708 RepID=A0A0A9C3C5_ARUDO